MFAASSDLPSLSGSVGIFCISTYIKFYQKEKYVNKTDYKKKRDGLYKINIHLHSYTVKNTEKDYNT